MIFHMVSEYRTTFFRFVTNWAFDMFVHSMQCSKKLATEYLDLWYG